MAQARAGRSTRHAKQAQNDLEHVDAGLPRQRLPHTSPSVGVKRAGKKECFFRRFSHIYRLVKTRVAHSES